MSNARQDRRDMFAAAALTGLLSSDNGISYEVATRQAWKHADLMIAAGGVDPRGCDVCHDEIQPLYGGENGTELICSKCWRARAEPEPVKAKEPEAARCTLGNAGLDDPKCEWTKQGDCADCEHFSTCSAETAP